jgi:putative transposase
LLRSPADAALAADFCAAVTLAAARPHVLAVIEHARRRVRVLGATAHPHTARVAQAARYLAIDPDDAGRTARSLIRDRDATSPAPFHALPADAGANTVPSGVRMPRMNPIIKRWIHSCRHELLDRTLICKPAPPPARPARLPAPPPRPQAPPGDLEHPAATSAARADHRSSHRHTARHPSA